MLLSSPLIERTRDRRERERERERKERKKGRSSRLPSLKSSISNHITTGLALFQITSFVNNVCHISSLSIIVSTLHHLRIQWVITPHLLHLQICLNLLCSICKFYSDCHHCQILSLVPPGSLFHITPPSFFFISHML